MVIDSNIYRLGRANMKLLFQLLEHPVLISAFPGVKALMKWRTVELPAVCKWEETAKELVSTWREWCSPPGTAGTSNKLSTSTTPPWYCRQHGKVHFLSCATESVNKQSQRNSPAMLRNYTLSNFWDSFQKPCVSIADVSVFCMLSEIWDQELQFKM